MDVSGRPYGRPGVHRGNSAGRSPPQGSRSQLGTTYGTRFPDVGRCENRCAQTRRNRDSPLPGLRSWDLQGVENLCSVWFAHNDSHSGRHRENEFRRWFQAAICYFEEEIARPYSSGVRRASHMDVLKHPKVLSIDSLPVECSIDCVPSWNTTRVLVKEAGMSGL